MSRPSESPSPPPARPWQWAALIAAVATEVIWIAMLAWMVVVG